MNPELAIESLYATGHWLLEQNRYSDAATVFRTMLVTAPTDERSWLALGACHEAIGQHDVALRLYRSGSETASSQLKCVIAQVRALRQLGQHDEAEEALDRAESMVDDADGSALVSDARRSS